VSGQEVVVTHVPFVFGPSVRRAAAVVGSVAVALASVGCARPTVERQVIATDHAPAAIGPYSQAIRVGDTLYLSGQLGLDPATGKLLDGTHQQTRQALQNCKALLEVAGFTLDDVVQVQVFLDDIADYPVVNTVYAGYFPDSPPARAAVEVADLPLDAKVEILMTAVRAR